jgi:hypothetical protein
MYTGKAATFTVTPPAYRLSESVTLKSSAFVMASFNVPRAGRRAPDVRDDDVHRQRRDGDRPRPAASVHVRASYHVTIERHQSVSRLVSNCRVAVSHIDRGVGWLDRCDFGRERVDR